MSLRLALADRIETYFHQCQTSYVTGSPSCLRAVLGSVFDTA